jgi:peptide/nickel transport system substrate-binding protein
VTAEVVRRRPRLRPLDRPLPFDPKRARELFNEAGWYDRDGDGWIDKDGRAFEFDLVYQAHKSSEAFALQFQQSLKRVGVRMNAVPLEWATLSSRVSQRDFDAAYKAWVMPLEADPEQRWHSRWAGPGTSNETSFADPVADRLIESFQRELDRDRRGAFERELHRRLYDAQAYMYGIKVR